MRELWGRAAWRTTAHGHPRGAPGCAGQLSHTLGDRRAAAPAPQAGTQKAGAAQGGPGRGEAVTCITTAESLPHRGRQEGLARRLTKGRALQDATLVSGVWGPSHSRGPAPTAPASGKGPDLVRAPCSVTHAQGGSSGQGPKTTGHQPSTSTPEARSAGDPATVGGKSAGACGASPACLRGSPSPFLQTLTHPLRPQTSLPCAVDLTGNSLRDQLGATQEP